MKQTRPDWAKAHFCVHFRKHMSNEEWRPLPTPQPVSWEANGSMLELGGPLKRRPGPLPPRAAEHRRTCDEDGRREGQQHHQQQFRQKSQHFAVEVGAFSFSVRRTTRLRGAVLLPVHALSGMRTSHWAVGVAVKCVDHWNDVPAARKFVWAKVRRFNLMRGLI